MADFITSKVKKPKDEVDLTEEEMKEWKRCAKNPAYFFRTYVYAQGQKGKVLFKLRGYQKRMLDGVHNNLFTIILASRQSGKSQFMAAYTLHQLIFRPDYNIGVTSYKNKNVKDIMSRFKYGYEHLPDFLKPPVTEYNAFTVRFSNGSMIEGEVTNETTFRGTTKQLVYSDELAFVAPRITEEFWSGLLPSIMAEGENATTKVVITSTPKRSSDLFASLWFKAIQGDNGFVPIEVAYDEVPGRTPAFEKSMLKKMSRNKFLSEYKNVFVSDSGTLINSLVLENIKTYDPVVEVSDEFWLWREDFKDRTLAMAIDVGEGVSEDYHVMQIADVHSMEQVGEFRNNTMTQTEFTREVIKVLKLLFDMGAKDIYYTVENNGVGAGVINLLYNASNDITDRAFFISDPEGKKLGTAMTRSSKPDGCAKLKDFVEGEKLILRSERLVTELKFFVKSGSSYKAESGMHDDLCMGMVLIMLLLKQVSDFEEETYERFNEIEFDIEQDSFEVGIF